MITASGGCGRNDRRGCPEGFIPLAYWGIFSFVGDNALKKCPNKLWLF